MNWQTRECERSEKSKEHESNNAYLQMAAESIPAGNAAYTGIVELVARDIN